MKIISLLLFFIGAALCSFGYWGMFTISGRRAYDEMDGMYPFFALVGGAVMILVVVALFLIGSRRSKKN